MSFVIEEIWDWLVLGAYRKFGWRGATIAILAPVAMIALAGWLIVVWVS